MENKETTLNIKQIDAVTSKAGREFWSIEDKTGEKFSCFEKSLIEKLQNKINQEVKVQIAINDQGFKNIRKVFIEDLDEVKKIKSFNPAETKRNEQNLKEKETNGEINILEAKRSKEISIYTSYVKDLFIATVGTEILDFQTRKAIMKECADLIKQAKESLKE